MDRRCLYGHRVTASFRHAIENDQCPVCGAEMISLDGYKIARQVAQSVPLDGTAAFRTVKLIEVRYQLVARTPDADAPADATAPSPAMPAGTEVLLDEEELADEELAAPSPAQPSGSILDELEDDESVELIAAEPTDESEVAASEDRRDRRGDVDFSAEEDAFFASSP